MDDPQNMTKAMFGVKSAAEHAAVGFSNLKSAAESAAVGLRRWAQAERAAHRHEAGVDCYLHYCPECDWHYFMEDPTALLCLNPEHQLRCMRIGVVFLGD